MCPLGCTESFLAVIPWVAGWQPRGQPREPCDRGCPARPQFRARPGSTSMAVSFVRHRLPAQTSGLVFSYSLVQQTSSHKWQSDTIQVKAIHLRLRWIDLKYFIVHFTSKCIYCILYIYVPTEAHTPFLRSEST